ADGIRDRLCDPRPRGVGRSAPPAGAARAGSDEAAPYTRDAGRQDRQTRRRRRRGCKDDRRSDEATRHRPVPAKTVGGSRKAPFGPEAGLDSGGPTHGDEKRRKATMLDGYIYNALRTPFGRHAGALARMRPDDMLAAVVSEVVKQSPFDPEKIEDVVVGCANQAGEDSRCVARHAGLLAGLPIEVAGSVLQRNCGSGLNAIVMAAQAVTCGEGEVMVAGGVESMSRAPFVMNKAETPFSRDGRIFDSTIGARF